MSRTGTPDQGGGRLSALERALADLRWAVAEGRPEHESHALLNHYERATDDLADMLRELSEQIGAARSNGRPAARALATAQRTYACMLALALEHMFAFEQFAALDELVRERESVWGDWVAGVLDALEPFRAALVTPLGALAECCERQLDAGATLTLTAQAISCGQPVQHSGAAVGSDGASPD